jgi:protein O-mannosyl-transferase
LKSPLTIATVVALILANLAVFGQVASFEFVYDDDVYVRDNPMVRQGLNRESVDWALRPQIGIWHPLTWLSLMLDVQLFGVRPGGHHLVNLLLHILNSVLLFWVLKRMTGAHWPSALVAALFAVHPLHVEPVAWISSRKDVLSTLFWMLSLWAYHAYSRRRTFERYMLVVACLFFGLTAKSMLVTLPCVLLLFDYWPLKRLADTSGWREAGRRWAVLLVEKLPLFAVAAFFCVMGFLAGRQGNVVVSLGGYSVRTRCENAILSYATYLMKTLWPQGLAPHYPHPGTSIAPLHVAAAVALLLAVTGLAVWARKRYPFLVVGWLWFLGTLVPAIGLVQVGAHAYADRYTYMPLIGVFIILAFGTAALATTWRVPRQVPATVCVALLGVLMVCAGFQARHWRDGVTLWTHTLRVTTENARAHNNLAYELRQRGYLEEAELECVRALNINPVYPHAHYNLGQVMLAQGRRDEAIAATQMALRCNPHFRLAEKELARLTSDEKAGGRNVDLDARGEQVPAVRNDGAEGQ